MTSRRVNRLFRHSTLELLYRYSNRTNAIYLKKTLTNLKNVIQALATELCFSEN
jgi:hypothetical protein